MRAKRNLDQAHLQPYLGSSTGPNPVQRLSFSGFDNDQRDDFTASMTYESSITPISPGDKVRFTAERLSVLTAPDRKRLEGRIGVVQGYWNFSRKLTVHFQQEGNRPELRILSVDPRQLERFPEEVISTDMPSEISNTPSGDEKLSQEDMDNLFG